LRAAKKALRVIERSAPGMCKFERTIGYFHSAAEKKEEKK